MPIEDPPDLIHEPGVGPAVRVHDVYGQEPGGRALGRGDDSAAHALDSDASEELRAPFGKVDPMHAGEQTARLRALAALKIAELGREMDALMYILTVLCQRSAAQDAPSAASTSGSSS